MIFRYPGAKTRLIPVIERFLFPRLERANSFHDVFVGGGSILCHVAKEFKDIELYANDLDPLMYAFWNLISKGKDREIDAFCKRIEANPTVKLFNSLRDSEPGDNVDMAYRAVFFNRCCFSGISTSGPIGGQSQKSKWAIDCRYNPTLIISKIKTMRMLFKDRLTVSNLNCIEYLDTVPKQSCLYLDPPYYLKGRELYAVYMEPKEHEKLAEKLISFSNPWVLSYDVCEEVTKLYAGRELIKIDANYSINGKKTTWNKKQEYIIL